MGLIIMTHERLTWVVDPIEGVGPDSRPMIDHGSKSDRMTRGDSVHYLKQPPKEIFIIFSIKYIIRQHENENKFLKKGQFNFNFKSGRLDPLHAYKYPTVSPPSPHRRALGHGERERIG